MKLKDLLTNIFGYLKMVPLLSGSAVSMEVGRNLTSLRVFHVLWGNSSAHLRNVALTKYIFVMVALTASLELMNKIAVSPCRIICALSTKLYHPLFFWSYFLILSFFLFSVKPFNCTEGEVRLEGGPDQFSGLVEVCAGGTYVLVCREGFDYRDAAVVCHQAGFLDKGECCLNLFSLLRLERNFKKLVPLAVGIPLSGNQFFADTVHLPIAFQGLGCLGNESNLSSCAQEADCLDCIRRDEVEFNDVCTSAEEAVAVSCEGKLLVGVTK